MHSATDGTPSDRRVTELEARLREAEETLAAIRNGEVDAIVVESQGHHEVYTLQSADRPYRVLIEQMQEGAVTVSADGTVLYCNRRFADMLAAPQEKVIGGSIFTFIRAAQRDRLDQLFAASAAGGGKGEFDLVTYDRTPVPAYLSFIDLPHERQRILCGVVTDLTQQKQAEFQQRSVEESLQIALDAAGLGHWNDDLTSGTAYRSPRHDAIFGYDPHLPWSRQAFLDHVVPEDRDAIAASMVAAERQQYFEFEGRIRRANDGAIRWIRVNGKTYYNDGKAVRMAGVVTDITERRQLEDQLRQAQKMEAVGQLTGGLAHDFNNLLSVILTSLELARRHASDDMLTRQLDNARRAANRGAGLTRQLLAFSRRQSLQPRVVCVNDRLPGLELLIQRAVGDNIELQLLPGDNLWYCNIDPHQLDSAILNLAINARDAMEHQGKLLIETANTVLSDADAAAIPDASPGRYVRVSVIDTGEGMSPEVQSRVFEPFFTTKEIGKGSGLGLSMVYGFVRQSNGHVGIESEVGRGTGIHLYLPWAEPPAAMETPDSVPQSSGLESATVLVVEDDPHVRPVVVELVREIGHTTVEAANGPRALKLLDERSDIDLVFTDIVMPGGVSGIDLAREARRRRPEIAVLLTSGFAAKPFEQGRDSAKEFRMIRKPYRRDELIRAIDAALAEVRADAGDGRI
ncbi:MAG TPA: ATP-binding protein [Gammaproteobacteria bacterium]|nr:ATP-binding protein [Gammaproteobacteria bacterium]